ncbi:hypothetical protein [Zoogloea sp.]|uniref:hypothetical protein n=1 Tax=Zoogloea sp. TaxID=49181 RepID=UPI001D25B3E2|nr:hypothetical protein [Zoogloea sp.]MBK6652378.1 hypothetical protein [Zoogloea sp.]
MRQGHGRIGLHLASDALVGWLIGHDSWRRILADPALIIRQETIGALVLQAPGRRPLR